MSRVQGVKTETTSGYYHHDMNFEHISWWAEEKPLVVIDNVQHHRVKGNKLLTSASQKAEIQN